MKERARWGSAARLGRLATRHPRHLVLCGALGGLLGAQHPASAALVATAAAALVVVASRGRLALLSAGAVAAVMAGALVGSWRLDAIDHSSLTELRGRTATLRGWLVKRERGTRGVRFRMRVTAVQARGRLRPVDEMVQVRVRRGAPADVVAIGAELVVGGVIGPPRSAPGGDFDYAAYLRRAGVHVVVSARFARATGRRRGGLAGFIDAVRRRAEDGVGAGLSPPMAALARGMVLGEDERIGDRTREDFNRSGLAHVLAVSGQNVVLLALLSWPLLAAAGLGRTGRLMGTLALIAVYVPLTGAGPSIVRAGVMGAAGILAALAGRPAGITVVCAPARGRRLPRDRPSRLAGRRVAAELRGGGWHLRRDAVDQTPSLSPPGAARRGGSGDGRRHPGNRPPDVLSLRAGLPRRAAGQSVCSPGHRTGDVDWHVERCRGSGFDRAGCAPECPWGLSAGLHGQRRRALCARARCGVGAGPGVAGRARGRLRRRRGRLRRAASGPWPESEGRASG